MHVELHASRFSHATCAVMLLAVATVGCQSVAQTGSGLRPQTELVNLGYGTTERSRLTTSVASLDSTDIEGLRVTTLEETLGHLPGVQVVRGAEGSQLRIRGTSSFLGTTDPLYVIDGLPLAFGMPDPLRGINPHDVARVDVLKDGGAAMFGSRGANGVVIITTKRAR